LETNEPSRANVRPLAMKPFAASVAVMTATKSRERAPMVPLYFIGPRRCGAVRELEVPEI